ncbi:chemoreceptor glutamine deamidase CheD [Halogeometricum borinquense DSM 11551]|uniref:Probable chemoreceptor glutamine deamidase CheD n=1 Tax=Halogeometricum borinquense (strain ATCC 700274 / DSM 11551 / JCM 10706 / KCTC 4070 / PR3) TaxID=469382 RepID=E4NP62_HALBP|nr:chemotaxis protein CheD [Halogeometricum borinquense]ADQ67603.1 chemotaxis protein [Halogeometricum borinquense DSM 11551]ELY23716.1 chemoreceptor glutamine deamidase CheD [Halogeometricum borinquense DSM 11551]
MKVYTSNTTETRTLPERTKVGIADYAVATGNATLTTSGLGSCVGIALYDSQAGVGGLAHAMLPYADGDTDEAKYADTAIRALLEAMVEKGAKRRRIRAKIAGGSTMFEFSSADGSIGERNAVAAKETLAREDIDLVAEDVGGEHGRSLELDVSNGNLEVRSAHVGKDTI